MVEGASQIGGFYIFSHTLIGIFAKCMNRRLLMKSIMEDTFMIKKNKDYLKIPDKPPAKQKASRSRGRSSNRESESRSKERDRDYKRQDSKKKSARNKELEEIPEEE